MPVLSPSYRGVPIRQAPGGDWVARIQGHPEIRGTTYTAACALIQCALDRAAARAKRYRRVGR